MFHSVMWWGFVIGTGFVFILFGFSSRTNQTVAVLEGLSSIVAIGAFLLIGFRIGWLAAVLWLPFAMLIGLALLLLAKLWLSFVRWSNRPGGWSDRQGREA